MHALLKVNKKHWVFLVMVIMVLSIIVAMYARWIDARSKMLISQVRSQLIPDDYRGYDANIVQQEIDPEKDKQNIRLVDNIAEGSCLSCAQRREMFKQKFEENKESLINVED